MTKHMSMGTSSTRDLRLGLLAALATACLLAACGTSQKKADVWDQYDIRVPVPAHSRVPTSAATQWQEYDPYRLQQSGPGAYGAYPVDNDAYYLPPTGAADINSETYD